MLTVRNTKTGTLTAGYLNLLKRSLHANVDFLEVIEDGKVLSDDEVREAIDSFKNRKPRAAKPKPASVAKDDGEKAKSGEPGPGEKVAVPTNVVDEILQAETKDDLIAIVRENFGEDLDKRKGVDKLRAEALTLAQE